IREPAATVMVSALTSPMMMPVEVTSMCLAAILPVSSPLTVTVAARTSPWCLAPGSIPRLPSTCTSPLKEPAMRTWPVPVILPSIDSPEAISDSRSSTRSLGRTADVLWVLAASEAGRSARGADSTAGRGVIGAGAGVGASGSFQRAIGILPLCVWLDTVSDLRGGRALSGSDDKIVHNCAAAKNVRPRSVGKRYLWHSLKGEETHDAHGK